MQFQPTAVLAISPPQILNNQPITWLQKYNIWTALTNKKRKKKSLHFDYIKMTTQPWVTHKLRSLKQLLNM